MFHITSGCLSSIMCWGASCTYWQTYCRKTTVLFIVISNSLSWSWSSSVLKTLIGWGPRCLMTAGNISTIVETLTRLLTYQRWCSDMTSATGWQRQRLVHVLTYLFIRYRACYQANCQLCPSYDQTKTDKELRAEKIQCENREVSSLKRQNHRSS